jgi:predicted transposase/invertase (TIGR01784 family)
MPPKDLHQPHDKLFKAGFSVPANTAAFLAAHRPSGLVEAVSWDSLQLEPGSFIDETFQHCESDLLFSTTLNGSPVLVYLLFEHQRQNDPWIALRLLKYQIGIWEQFRSKQPQATRLPLIIPVVLAQNANHWEISTQFADLLDLSPEQIDQLSQWLPCWTFRLIQLADLPFDKILGTPAGIMVLRTLKAEQTHQLLAPSVWDETLLSQLPSSLVKTLLTYIFHAGSVDKQAFMNNVVEVTKAELKYTAMTLAQQFHQEGLQEGLQKGEFAIISRQLSRKFPNIAEQVMPKLQQMNEERLFAFSEALLFLQSEQDCLDWLNA